MSMLKKFIILVEVIIITFICFHKFDYEKEADLKLLREYLAIPAPCDTVNVASHYYVAKSFGNCGNNFVMWLSFESKNINVNTTIEKLKMNNWKFDKIEKTDRGTVYYFLKDNMYYWVGCSKGRNIWSEYIGYEKD